jgi:hypothetical protein
LTTPPLGETKEMPLVRSTVTGPAVRVVLDHRVLARALPLGSRAPKLTPDKPVVAYGDAIAFIIAPLDPRSRPTA